VNGATWQRGVAEPLLVFSVHAPSHGQSYATQVNKILDEIKAIVGDRECVVGGDFNMTVSHYSGSARPTSKRDLKIQERLAVEFNVVNCWQEANPDRPLQQTLRWTGDRTTAYHCDGLFVPKSWRYRLRSCCVLAGDEWNAMSDHNPIIAEFE
jgi:endonuclease/exonuclease/phosphatase family metal-dependent hydrolase